MKLQPMIENQILSTMGKIVPQDQVKEIFILGSVTGYQYDDDSDIDVNLRVPDALITPEAHVIRKKLNGQIAFNTKHTINYFLQPYEKASNWQDAYFGVYDVLNHAWVSSPKDNSTIRDPKQEFYFDLMFGNQMLEYFRSLVKKWQKQKNKKNPTSHDIELTKQFFNDAKEYAQYIDSQRKLEYKWGWGIPRKNWRNVIYKLIEHSDVGEAFEYLKEIKDPNDPPNMELQ
ncbi:hypothetical protein KC678_05655 [Candidatus Dojkabacteria bacterium]|uniref:Uncharacterized protein n=1 Tax=Candidatus Dojkabacteria bacterium TaxID=2099670 RepID=A0A955L2I0_9BACT|nr:hypothetical protein [Candidatus Dojkabacteria bacterium]